MLEVDVPASTIEDIRPWKQLSSVRKKLLFPAPGGPKRRMLSILTCAACVEQNSKPKLDKCCHDEREMSEWEWSRESSAVLVRDRGLLNAHLCCPGNLELENVLEKLLAGPKNMKEATSQMRSKPLSGRTSGLVRPWIVTAQQYNTIQRTLRRCQR